MARRTKHMNPSYFYHPVQINERYKHYPGPFAIDEKQLNGIFPGIKDIEVNPYNQGYYEYQKGDLDEPNMKLITRLVKYLQPLNIVEIGTFRGRTTFQLAKYSPKGKVTTIDIANLGPREYSGTDLKYQQEKRDVGRAYKKSSIEDRVHQIICDSTAKKCQRILDGHLGRHKIDFAFIDGGHDYDTVRHDFEEVILPRLRKGGVVVFDDYNRPLSIMGVTHYLLKKAYEDGYVFYWYAPRNSPHTNEVIFINNPESRCYNWRNR